MSEIGIPYAMADFDEQDRYHVVCPVCGQKCYDEPGAVESLHPSDRSTAEDATTKGAGLVYAAHYEQKHGAKS